MTSTQSNSKGVAVVTGSAQGIGRSIAIRLAVDGYDVVINDLESNKENLEEVKKEIVADLPERRVLVVLGDVSVEEDVKGLIESAVKEFGNLNVFVANAGICKSKPLLEIAKHARRDIGMQSDIETLGDFQSVCCIQRESRTW